MSTSLLERPVQTISIPEIAHPCEERRSVEHEAPVNWTSRMILKSYLSSFNLCLNDLGWVPRNILEVGCGDGTLLSYVAQTFMDAEEVVGIEFDDDKVALAKEKNCCRIDFRELGEAETLPFDTGSFDLVISHGFLGQTPMPRFWLAEMSRVTAEALIISSATPVGYKWLQKFPGAKQARLLGNSVFAPDIEPVSLNQLKSWSERLGLKVDSAISPAPFGMVLARKPQQANPN